MAGILPYGNLFPGFTSYGVVSDQVKELATTFNAEGVEALQTIPDKPVMWAELGSRVTVAPFQGKIPVRLTSLLGYEPFEGERKYHQVMVSAVQVKVAPWQLNLEWAIQLANSGIPQLQNYYGISGIAGDVVGHARAFKADLLATLIMAGMTNASLGMIASAFTLPQPGLPNGLPLFSDGSTSGSSQHYSNPLDLRSKKFSNLFLNATKIETGDVMGTVQTNMSQIPHPSKANMTLGLEVTDLIGPTNMLIPFAKLAIQNLSLQTVTSPANLAAATTNIYNPTTIMENAGKMIGAAGITPWRFWIAPQLDAHPYVVANPTKQMWLAVSRTRPSLCWAELGGPNKEFMPKITLMGDGTEEAIKSRKVRLLSDIDGGIAAGLPHCIAQYFETTP